MPLTKTHLELKLNLHLASEALAPSFKVFTQPTNLLVSIIAIAAVVN
jgi:hypothetical protein